MNKIPANCTSSAQNKRLYYIAPEENLVIFLLLKVHMNSSIVHFHLFFSMCKTVSFTVVSLSTIVLLHLQTKMPKNAKRKMTNYSPALEPVKL